MNRNNFEIPLQPGVCYHIYNHANGFENIFANRGNYHFFLKKYAQHISPVADTFAYCLMPNHFHLLVRVKAPDQLPESCTSKAQSLPNLISKRFSNLFSSYTQAFNKQQKRMGGLFISNFKRKEVTDLRYFIRVLHYIHYNPVKDGFVSDPLHWPHSSLHSLLSDKPTLLLRAEILELLGSKEALLLKSELS